ncbi:hypothetical protein EDEG_00885 [Edhazardia aedis USNM 41457]|uniref:Spindle assembly abnormal protein 6 N-terminal domain-containing protein n=1 Tax=Edhazardia aedis (strain USNM 41457) TaxID=1003232 RepID=J9DR08_EDHAE|nr:hypothetical protein EDEG_00885 [Edhazardia aedis USNM 41457]|eukprot:EJW05015.1 hypothetical protein EDEG_00885 [Edhazardia aedis USNM 41457]
MTKPLFTGRIPISSESFTHFKADLIKNTKIDIRLIDTTNIFNIYVCSITPGDFSVTKREQGIKVDFDKFTKILCQFFLDLQNNEMIATFEKLTLKNQNEEIFKFTFLENNMFRNIVRLELLFYKPDDTEFRKYLSDLITRFEEDNVKLIRENLSLRDAFKQKSDEFTKVCEESETMLNDLKSKNEKLFQNNCLLEDENESLKNGHKKLEKRISDMNKIIENCKDDQEKASKLEVKNSTILRDLEELKRNLKKLEDENEILNKENRDFRDELKKVKRKFGDKEIRDLEQKEEIKMYIKEIDARKKEKKAIEEKFQTLQEAFYEKDLKLKEYERMNNALMKKLENAQSVYEHFYKKNVGNDLSDDVSNFTNLRPESPPHK